VTPTRNGYVVTFRATNQGDVTAADLMVEGELLSGAEIVERSSAALSYVPPRSQRLGGLFFTRDPRTLDLKLRATGYEQP
jgi:uncharacterized protein (TIGR02588 family)